jgi:hypothetical protein
MVDQDEVQIIEPDQAGTILTAKIAELESEGWVMIVRTDYMARLTRGRRNLDVEIDLLGSVSERESPLSAAQESGQIIGVLLILVAVLLVITVASVLGLFS